MHKAVLMHADIHKGAKIHDISDRASEFHPRLQIFERKNILPQDRPLHIQSGVPPRLRKLRKDVLQSVFTKSGIPGKLLQRKASIAGRTAAGSSATHAAGCHFH